MPWRERTDTVAGFILTYTLHFKNGSAVRNTRLWEFKQYHVQTSRYATKFIYLNDLSRLSLQADLVLHICWTKPTSSGSMYEQTHAQITSFQNCKQWAEDQGNPKRLAPPQHHWACTTQERCWWRWLWYQSFLSSCNMPQFHPFVPKLYLQITQYGLKQWNSLPIHFWFSQTESFQVQYLPQPKNYNLPGSANPVVSSKM